MATNGGKCQPNSFTWIIKNYNETPVDKLYSDYFKIERVDKSINWRIYCYKISDIISFYLYNDHKPDGRISTIYPIEIKLTIGEFYAQQVFSQILKISIPVEFFMREKYLSSFLSFDGSLFINVTMNLLPLSTVRNFPSTSVGINFSLPTSINVKSIGDGNNFPLPPLFEKKSTSNGTNSSPSPPIETKSASDGKNFVFKSFLHNETLSDVVFQIDEQEVPAHKIVLASVSSIFNEMFTQEIQSNLTSIVKIKEADPNVFKQFLSYIYTNRVDNLEKVAFELYELANKYNVSDLKAICEECLNKSLAVDNVIDILHLADRCNAVNLKNQCLEYIDSHLEEVQGTEPFKNLGKELLMDLYRAARVKKPRNLKSAAASIFNFNKV